MLSVGHVRCCLNFMLPFYVYLENYLPDILALPMGWKCHKGPASLSVHYFVLSIGHAGSNMVGAK